MSQFTRINNMLKMIENIQSTTDSDDTKMLPQTDNSVLFEIDNTEVNYKTKVTKWLNGALFLQPESDNSGDFPPEMSPIQCRILELEPTNLIVDTKIDKIESETKICKDIDDVDNDKDWKEKGNDDTIITKEDDDQQDNIIKELTNDIIRDSDDICAENAQKTNRDSRKRVKNSDDWEIIIKKTKLNLEEAYVNTRKLVAKEQVQPSCDKCIYKCSQKFTQTHREHLLDVFWKIGDITLQRAFIVNHTSVVSAKYNYKTERPRRSFNNSFFLPINNTNHRVCKKMFMSTLCIGNRFIRTSLAKHIWGELSVKNLRENMVSTEH